MEKESQANKEIQLVEKLRRTSNKIQKARKNLKLAEKEAAEFQEIHKLLEEDDISSEADKNPKETYSGEISSIPLKFPGIKIFHDDLVFSLFKQSNCNLKNFLLNEKNCLVFGKNESVPTEECFRNLISSRIAEVLMPEDRNSPSVCLYVFYLLSVHQEPEFVRACFDFLKQQVFYLCPEDIFPIFINFGSKQGDLFEFSEEGFLKRFPRKDGVEKIYEKASFPFFNMEMVGQILLYCITKDLVIINEAVKPLVRGLAKITLDPKVYSGSLLPLYSTILSALCGKIQKDFKLEEIVDWIHFEGEPLLNQLEVCRLLSKAIIPALQESLVLKTVSQILGLKTLSFQPPIKIDHLKSILKILKTKKLSPLKLFCILQLLNGSLPGLTATFKDSTDIKAALGSLEKKISETEDSVDLIRLKLEAAKVGNLVTNNMNNRFAIQDF